MSYRKPPPGAQIDWQHPLARGLGDYWLLRDSMSSVLKRRGTVSGGSFNSYGFVGDGSTNKIQNASIGQLNTGPLTLTAEVYKSAVGDGSTAYIIHAQASGDAAIATILFHDAADRLVCRIGTGSTGVQHETNAPLFTVANQRVVVSATWTGSITGTEIRLYANGVALAMRNNANGNTGVSDSGSLMISGRSYDDLRNWKGGIGRVCIHRRALNPSEIAKLHAEPYSMFWVRRRTIFVPTGTGGPVTHEEGGTIGVNATVAGAATVELVGAGSISVNAGVAGAATVDVQGVGSVTVNATVAGAATVDLAGGGTTTANTGVAGSATVTLEGTGTITVNAGVAGDADAGTTTWQEGGTIGVTAGVAGDATVELVGSGTITVQTGVAGEWDTGVVTWEEGGTIAVQTGVAGIALVDLSGAGTITVRTGVAGEWDTGTVTHEEGGLIAVNVGVAGEWSLPPVPVEGRVSSQPIFSW